MIVIVTVDKNIGDFITLDEEKGIWREWDKMINLRERKGRNWADVDKGQMHVRGKFT